METEVQAAFERSGGGEGRADSIFAGAQRPLTLKFEHVVYKVKTTTGAAAGESGKQNEKVILKGISGAVLPGEMMAMLGPSGSGKTTLLTLLGGRGDGRRHCLAGGITYNGRPFSSSLKRSIGFVTQDDVLYPHLTVGETLHYTALLRLPKILSRAEKAAHADAVLEQLGLGACRGSVVGGPLLRGVSGGERKRVSIGLEMIVDPSLLLLDEPTSGLDSTTAARIVSTVWELARGGRTVVMTIHQPSSQLFYMFHKLLLLSDGNPIYYGKGSAAMGYFASIGHSPTVAMNPADFLLDLANGVSSDETSSTEARSSAKAALASAYRLHLGGPVAEELSGLTDKQHQPSEKVASTQKWCTSWCQQFSILLRRDLRERRHEAFATLQLIQVFAVAVLCGILWFHSSGKPQDQLGLLFFFNGFWGFYPAYKAIYTFPLERTMLTKERFSGMYRLSSYFAARMAADLPMELALPVGSTCIAYWMAGLRPDAASFFKTLATVLLNVVVSQGVGLALGAAVMDIKSATILASVVMQTFMLTGGFFVQNLPPFVAWIKYVSFNYYTFKLQLVSQFSAGEMYRCGPASWCRIADLPTAKMVGFEHVGLAVAALFVMLVVYRVIAYLGLMMVGASN